MLLIVEKQPGHSGSARTSSHGNVELLHGRGVDPQCVAMQAPTPGIGLARYRLLDWIARLDHMIFFEVPPNLVCSVVLQVYDLAIVGAT